MSCTYLYDWRSAEKMGDNSAAEHLRHLFELHTTKQRMGSCSPVVAIANKTRRSAGRWKTLRTLQTLRDYHNYMLTSVITMAALASVVSLVYKDN